jgi:hypothetical protein
MTPTCLDRVEAVQHDESRNGAQPPAQGRSSEKAKLNGYNEPESYYGSKLVKYGDTTDHKRPYRMPAQGLWHQV